MNNSGGPLDNQTRQTEWKAAPLAKVQLCEYENQTLEAFVSASRFCFLIFIFYAKFDCPVAYQKFLLLVTAHDYETGLLLQLRVPNIPVFPGFPTRAGFPYDKQCMVVWRCRFYHASVGR